MVRRLGELEAEIMDRLWSWDRPATVREVVDDLNRQRPVAYTTVLTVADILHTKGLLSRHKEGRAWVYRPTAGRAAHTAALMADALGTDGDAPAALAHFVGGMAPEDLAALRRALADLDAPPGGDPQ
ncbi:BlaI/MecI/CopY family transcriptional regulator [Kitasatospora sp. NPDC059571]|uniref:BlaI/MecI/CopY family transcriptional regulator n=1 Tax=Kitasatospora sp. NPDC059571 TaxID=3346871 RepID=UPI0036BAE7C0